MTGHAAGCSTEGVRPSGVLPSRWFCPTCQRIVVPHANPTATPPQPTLFDLEGSR